MTLSSDYPQICVANMDPTVETTNAAYVKMVGLEFSANIVSTVIPTNTGIEFSISIMSNVIPIHTGWFFFCQYGEYCDSHKYWGGVFGQYSE